MSLSVRGADSHAIGSGTAPTLAEPAGTVPGDFLLAYGIGDALTGFAAPPGWTRIYSGRTTGTFPVDSHLIFTQRGPTAPNLTWALTGTHYREVYILAITSSRSWTVVIDSQASGATGINNTNHPPDPPATTTFAQSTLVLAGGWNYAGSVSAWGASAGYVIQTNNAAGNDGFIESKTLSAPGTEDPAVVSGQVTGTTRDWWDGFTLTLVETIDRPRIWTRPFPFTAGSPPSRNPPYR